MLYTLLQDNRIVVGPRDWNPRYFEHFIQELGFDAKLSDSSIIENINFSENVRLVITHQEPTPAIDPNFEVLAGPFFKFDEHNNHVSYYLAQPLSLDTIRNNLKAIVATNRWNKEISPITRDINGKQLTLSTDRESRAMFVQALTLVPDNYEAQWKFAEGFAVINKSDLQLIVTEILNHVQSCFDWESQKANEINSTNDVEGLKQIILE